jgi:hypothetical protein
MEAGFFLLVLLIVLCVSSVLIKLAIGIRLSSMYWITSSERHDDSSAKFHQRFWKSCKPLDIWVGSFFVFSSPDFFLHVYGKIILESVIDLLLAVRGVEVAAKALLK